MPQILRVCADQSEEAVITTAAEIVSRGGVIAYPTETIYGLGTDATNEQAIRKIFEIKGRNFKNPISVIIGNIQDVDPLVLAVPETARKLMDVFWPGPLTLVFKSANHLSPLLTANSGKIGIRLSAHDAARRIARKLGKPLTATSANLSGSSDCRNADQVIHQIGGKIDAVVDLGETEGNLSSTVVDVTSEEPFIVRPGVIPREEIDRHLMIKLL